MRRSASLLVFAALALPACSDQPASVLEPVTPAFSRAPDRQTISFAATAQCGPDTGENIAFGGTIENQVHEMTDATGKIHRHRVFRTRGMTGTGVVSGTQYNVVGGAEMFSWQFDGDGNQRILIHEGTLVFQTSDHRIVARHVIRNVPGQDGVLNTWACQRVSG
jgi:hypothetical protein